MICSKEVALLSNLLPSSKDMWKQICVFTVIYKLVTYWQYTGLGIYALYSIPAPGLHMCPYRFWRFTLQAAYQRILATLEELCKMQISSERKKGTPSTTQTPSLVAMWLRQFLASFTRRGSDAVVSTPTWNQWYWKCCTIVLGYKTRCVRSKILKLWAQVQVASQILLQDNATETSLLHYKDSISSILIAELRVTWGVSSQKKS